MRVITVLVCNYVIFTSIQYVIQYVCYLLLYERQYERHAFDAFLSAFQQQLLVHPARDRSSVAS